MRGRAGLAVVSSTAMLCIPRVAPAGCPAMSAANITCDSHSSTIAGCANAVWRDLLVASVDARSLETTPENPADRMATLRKFQAAVLPAIRLLGAARDYDDRNFNPSCDATWDGIDLCERALASARRGLEVLARPELVAALSPATRERLEQILRQHETPYAAKLDLIAASGQGDASQLCNAIYASVASCERAVAADSTALRERVFPVIMCGRVVPGRFVTEKDAAAEAQRDAEHPELDGTRLFEFTFDDALRFYQSRLQQETELLKQAKQAAGAPPDAARLPK
jgi:hypothetical protein